LNSGRSDWFRQAAQVGGYRRRPGEVLLGKDHRRDNPIRFTVKPAEAWTTVVLNRWKQLCPSCFNQEAQKAGVRFSFANLQAMSWSDRPPPRNPYKRIR
jgi:hypothetical protein